MFIKRLKKQSNYFYDIFCSTFSAGVRKRWLFPRMPEIRLSGKDAQFFSFDWKTCSDLTRFNLRVPCFFNFSCLHYSKYLLQLNFLFHWNNFKIYLFERSKKQPFSQTFLHRGRGGRHFFWQKCLLPMRPLSRILSDSFAFSAVLRL